MSSHETLSAAANDRKARLAQLKSLKRKQAPDTEDTPSASVPSEDASTALTRTETPPSSVAQTILSGRNYDPTTRNVKLGFEAAPISDPTQTLEYKAEQLALEQKRVLEEEKKEDKPLDLFKLQPKKPNWDLKRDLEGKMRGLGVQTDNAIARLVRERVEQQKKEGEKKIEGRNGGEKRESEGEEVGIEGSELVEAMHLKEREEEDDRRRDAEDEDVS